MELKVKNIIGVLNVTVKGGFIRPCDLKRIKDRVNTALIDVINSSELSEGSSIDIDTLVGKVNVINE